MVDKVIFLVKTYEFLLKLADFYQIEHVVQKCDKFISKEDNIPIEKKLFMLDKYELPETKKSCLNSGKHILSIRNFIQTPEYGKISDELKIVLLESVVKKLVHNGNTLCCWL